MYNEIIKQKYIEKSLQQYSNADVSYTRAFNRIEPFEEKYGKDCYEFTTNEILDYFSYLCSSSIAFLRDQTSIYVNYTTYCIANNLVKDNMNHWSEITGEFLASCINNGLINKKIVTRDELLDIIKTFHNPSDSAIALAIFEGFNGKLMSDLTDLTSENIDGDVCHVNGKDLVMSKELKEYFLQSIEEEYYISSNENISQFEPSDKVFKDKINCVAGADTQVNKRKRLYNKLVRLKEEFGMECLTLMGLKESGRIHCLKQYQEEHNCSFQEAMLKTKSFGKIYGRVRSTTEYMLRFGIED